MNVSIATVDITFVLKKLVIKMSISCFVVLNMFVDPFACLFRPFRAISNENRQLFHTFTIETVDILHNLLTLLAKFELTCQILGEQNLLTLLAKPANSLTFSDDIGN